MLILSLNNIPIPLPQDFSLQLTWKSPLVNFEKIPSGYALGITIPMNEYTRYIFNHPEMFINSREPNSHRFPNFEIAFSGVQLMKGTLIINSTTADSIEATLIDQVGTLGEKQQDKFIADCPTFANVLPFNNGPHWYPGQDPYCCIPVTDQEFFTNKGVKCTRTITIDDPDRPGKTKKVDFTTEVNTFLFNKISYSKVNMKNPDYTVSQIQSDIDITVLKEKGNTYEVGRITVISPFFFVVHILKELFKAENIHIVQNYLLDNEILKGLCIYNNYDITEIDFEITPQYMEIPRAKHLWSVTVDPAELIFLGNKITAYKRSYTDMYSMDGVNDLGKVITKNHLPKISLGEFLLSLQNLLNICFHFLPNETVNIYDRQSILIGEAIDINEYFTGSWEIGQKKNVTLKFTRDTDDKDLIFEERFNDLSDRHKDIKEPLDSYADLPFIQNPEVGEIRYLRQSDTFMEYKWITVAESETATFEPRLTDYKGWEEISINLQNGFYNYGQEEEEEIKTSLGALTGYQGNAFANVQGNMDAWQSTKQEFAPRLLIQSLNRMGGGNEIPQFSFEYEKESIGLFARFWQYWNPFWANRLEVTANFNFSLNALQYVSNNICQKFRTNDGEFLIEEMSCEIHMNYIGVTNIKGFKVE